MKAAVLTVSTSRAEGDDEDVSGQRLAELCEEAGLEVVRDTVADDREAIALALKRLADTERVRFVFTTGGTGPTPDGLTPPATPAAIDPGAPRHAPAPPGGAPSPPPLGPPTRVGSG